MGIGPRQAVWSPDRRHIAVAAADGKVYVMNADGTGQTEIADVDGDLGAIDWLG